ncbi:Heme-binding protein 2 [Halocaridina rubra]|uniref:Heme-binding protein 1 n=1 Tax=Halocaridina rubra TaxID=373956 RepID=A0AAN8XMD9_HALRR
MAGIIKGIKAAFGDVEMAPYTIIVERGGYEERLYPARKWACTKMKGMDQSSLISPMFRKLFNYISGKNEPNIRIDMTSPVTTYVEPSAGPTCESTFTMGFLVPEEHQNLPPPPSDKSIFIEERPTLTVYTRRFGGYTSDDIILKEARDLAEEIQKQNEPSVNFDQYYIVGYDPPFKLFGRRNEIWFVKNTDNGEFPREQGKAETANGTESVITENIKNGNVVQQDVEVNSEAAILQEIEDLELKD